MKCRNLPGEADRAQQQRRSGEPVDQPDGRDARHPRADERDALPAEEEPEVAMAQRAPCVRGRPVPEGNDSLSALKYCLTHVRCYLENGTPIASTLGGEQRRHIQDGLTHGQEWLFRPLQDRTGSVYAGNRSSDWIALSSSLGVKRMSEHLDRKAFLLR